MHHSFLSQTSHTFEGALGARMGFIKRRFTFKEDNLYAGENPLEFILVPKCPLLVGFTVVVIFTPCAYVQHG